MKLDVAEAEAAEEKVRNIDQGCEAYIELELSALEYSSIAQGSYGSYRQRRGRRSLCCGLIVSYPPTCCIYIGGWINRRRRRARL